MIRLKVKLMKEKEEENNDKKIKDLIDDNIEENEKKLDENRISNGLSDSQNNNISNISEKEEEFKPKKKYIPRNEQEALKAKIINLELKEKPNNNDIYQDYNYKIHENIDIGIRYTKEKFKIPKELKKNENKAPPRNNIKINNAQPKQEKKKCC